MQALLAQAGRPIAIAADRAVRNARRAGVAFDQLDRIRREATAAAERGVHEAARRYDSAQGVLFGTYADRRVQGAVADALRADDSAQRGYRARQRAFIEACDAYKREHGVAPSDLEIAKRLGWGKEVLQKFRNTHGGVVPLDDALDVADGNAHDPVARIARKEKFERVKAALAKMNPRLRQVIVLYYFQELTLKQIGTELGVNESRACQLRSDAVTELRRLLKHRIPAPAACARAVQGADNLTAGVSQAATR
ncbi:MAG: sigma-70 family RNA polymerase sigma factor [Myxococcaceae bacterium]